MSENGVETKNKTTPASWFSRQSAMAQTMLKVEAAVFCALLILGYAVMLLVRQITGEFKFERPLPYLFGLLIGCAISAAKVLLLEKALTQAVGKGKRAQNYAFLQSFLRYAGTVIILIPVFLLRAWIGVVGVVAGLLSLQITAFATTVITAKDETQTSTASGDSGSTGVSDLTGASNSAGASGVSDN